MPQIAALSIYGASPQCSCKSLMQVGASPQGRSKLLHGEASPRYGRYAPNRVQMRCSVGSFGYSGAPSGPLRTLTPLLHTSFVCGALPRRASPSPPRALPLEPGKGLRPFSNPRLFVSVGDPYGHPDLQDPLPLGEGHVSVLESLLPSGAGAPPGSSALAPSPSSGFLVPRNPSFPHPQGGSAPRSPRPYWAEELRSRGSAPPAPLLSLGGRGYAPYSPSITPLRLGYAQLRVAEERSLRSLDRGYAPPGPWRVLVPRTLTGLRPAGAYEKPPVLSGF